MKFEQLSLTDALAVRAEAVERADAHAAPDWKVEAHEAVRWCARNLSTFTTDDVWMRMARVAESTTHQPSALGPVMQAAARAGAIVRTGLYRPSRLPQRHRDLTVWTAGPH